MISLTPTNRATLIGCSAILIWSTLATLTALSGTVPPFQLATIAFGVASLLNGIKWIVKGASISSYFLQKPKIWAIGLGGLFGFNSLYFFALKQAPVIEATLIIYFWPLLLVLFSAALLPGRGIKPVHVVGVLLGLAGTMILLMGDGFQFKFQYWLGYIVSMIAAITWAGYSLLSGRQKGIPADFIGAVCMVCAVLSFGGHLVFETTVWPEELIQWLAMVAIGIGPMGLAYYVWDYGMKHGNVRTIASCSYIAPLLSSLLLVATGFAQPSTSIVVACMLIICGAVVGGLDMVNPRPKIRPQLTGGKL